MCNKFLSLQNAEISDISSSWSTMLHGQPHIFLLTGIGKSVFALMLISALAKLKHKVLYKFENNKTQSLLVFDFMKEPGQIAHLQQYTPMLEESLLMVRCGHGWKWSNTHCIPYFVPDCS